MKSIKGVIHKEHYATTLCSETHELIADEPVSAGGTDKGFSPTELLAASLAACTSITLRMYADKKNWPLEMLEVNINVETDTLKNVTNIHRSIQMFGVLSEEQKKRLLDIANHCPIHKILSNRIDIKTELYE